MRKKTGGRKKGTCNKVTATIRERLELMLNQCIEDFNIHELSKKERIELIGKILPFLIPKLNSITMDDKNTDDNYFKPIEVRIIKQME